MLHYLVTKPENESPPKLFTVEYFVYVLSFSFCSLSSLHFVLLPPSLPPSLSPSLLDILLPLVALTLSVLFMNGWSRKTPSGITFTEDTLRDQRHCKISWKYSVCCTLYYSNTHYHTDHYDKCVLPNALDWISVHVRLLHMWPIKGVLLVQPW